MQSQQALIHPPDTCQKVQAFPKRWGLRKVPPPSLRPLPEFPLVLFRRLLGDWVMRLNLDTVCVGPSPPASRTPGTGGPFVSCPGRDTCSASPSTPSPGRSPGAKWQRGLWVLDARIPGSAR